MNATNKKVVYIDIRRVVALPPINFNQNDTNVIEFVITENRIPADLTNIGRVAINFERPDNEIIYKDLTINENKAIYKMGSEEMKVAGKCWASISFYDLDKKTKLSSRSFAIYLRGEIK